MLSPSKVIRNPDPQVFVPINPFNLIVVHINWEIEIVAAGMNMYLVLFQFRERWF